MRPSTTVEKLAALETLVALGRSADALPDFEKVRAQAVTDPADSGVTESGQS